MKNKTKYYIVSEEQLQKFIENSLQLGELEYGGVDNWTWYGEGREEYLETILGPERFKELSEEDDYISYEDIAREELSNYEIFIK